MSKGMMVLSKWSLILALVVIASIGSHGVVVAAGENRTGETATAPKAPEEAGAAGRGSAAKGTTTPEQEEPRLTLLKIIRLGGPLMYVLFALSIAMVAMITYFFLAFNPRNIMPPDFLKRIRQATRDKKLEEAKMICAQNRNIVSHIIRSGLDAVHRGPRAVLEAMNSEGGRRSSSLWQKISFLSDIAVISPMVGLLGTVIGMFQAFMSVSSSGITAGQINPAYLTSGVAQAVVTTIAGLIIGILATMAYAYFRGVVQRLVVNLEAVCSRYSEIIAEGAE